MYQRKSVGGVKSDEKQKQLSAHRFDENRGAIVTELSNDSNLHEFTQDCRVFALSPKLAKAPKLTDDEHEQASQHQNPEASADFKLNFLKEQAVRNRDQN